MLININIPTHPVLDESDMYVANPDISTCLQSQASLSSRLYILDCMLWQAKQSELRVPPKSAALTNQKKESTIIVFMIDHRGHGRVLDRCCTSLVFIILLLFKAVSFAHRILVLGKLNTLVKVWIREVSEVKVSYWPFNYYINT